MHVKSNPLEAVYAAPLSLGLDGTGEAPRILVNEASKIERSYFLNAHCLEKLGRHIKEICYLCQTFVIITINCLIAKQY